MPVAGVHGDLLLPKVAQRFRREKANDDDQHNRLAEQAEARLVQLGGVHILAVRDGAKVVHETAAYLKEHLDAVDEEEDDHDEQQGGVAAVEEVGAAAGKQMRVRDLRQEQTVR